MSHSVSIPISSGQTTSLSRKAHRPYQVLRRTWNIKAWDVATVPESDVNTPSTYHWQLRDIMRCNDDALMWISGTGVMEYPFRERDPPSICATVSFPPTCIDVQGKTIALGGQEGDVALVSDKQIRLNMPHLAGNDTINTMCLSHGKVLIGANDSKLHIIDASTGTEELSLSLKSPVNTVSPGHDFMAIGCDDDHIRIYSWDWQLVTLLPIPSPMCTAVSVSPTQLVACGTELGDLIVFDLSWSGSRILCEETTVPLLIRPHPPHTYPRPSLHSLLWTDPSTLLFTEQRSTLTRLSLGPSPGPVMRNALPYTSSLPLAACDVVGLAHHSRTGTVYLATTERILSLKPPASETAPAYSFARFGMTALSVPEPYDHPTGDCRCVKSLSNTIPPSVVSDIPSMPHSGPKLGAIPNVIPSVAAGIGPSCFDGERGEGK